MEKTIKVYNYDPVTGVFIGGSYARQDPLEKDRYLVPKNATEIIPPLHKKNEVACFDEKNQKWVIKKSFVGQKMYNKMTGEEKLIDFIGDIPDNYTLKPKPDSNYFWVEEIQDWVPDLPSLKQEKKKEIRKNYLQKKYEPLEFKDTKIEISYETIQEFLGILQIYSKNSTKTFLFFDINGEELQLKRSEIHKLVETFINRDQDLKKKLVEKENEIKKSDNEIKLASISF